MADPYIWTQVPPRRGDRPPYRPLPAGCDQQGRYATRPGKGVAEGTADGGHASSEIIGQDENGPMERLSPGEWLQIAATCVPGWTVLVSIVAYLIHLANKQ